MSITDIKNNTSYIKELKNTGEYNCVIREFKHGTRVCVYNRMQNIFNKTVKDDGRTHENFEYQGLLHEEDINKYELFRDANSKQITFEDVNNYVCCGVDPVASDGNCRDRNDSIKRSKDKFFDICLNNDFSLFVTLTINDNVLDSRSNEDVRKALYKWCKSTVKTYGMRYALVPEYHYDGKRIHFHGFIAYDRPLVLERAYSKKTGKPLFTRGSHRPIFNLPRWTYGYTTAIPIDDNYIRTVRYVCKYITKDTEKIFGKRYFAGGKINREPLVTHYEIVDYDAVNLREYNIPNSKRKIKYDLKYKEKVDNTSYNIDGTFK